MEKLTRAQRQLLTRCVDGRGRYVTGRYDTATVLSLERRGLITWERGSPVNYARVDEAVVTITPAGRALLQHDGEG